MNGNGRLYRSKSNGAIGGVAAGIANYFNIDPVIVRLAFVLLTIVTSGAFLAAYLAMWVIIPTAGSTATTPNDIVHENLNEMGSKIRGIGSSGTGATRPPGQTNGGAAGSANPSSQQGPDQVQMAQTSVATRHEHGFNPMILVAIGAFFLLMNMGLFRAFHMGSWWPLFLVGLGVIMLSRRR